MNSPAQQSIALLKSEGYTVGITEHFNSFARIRQDLFGFIDMVAVRPQGMGVLAVQTTSRANVNARLEKILVSKNAKVWLEAGNDIEIHGWAKMGARGERKLWKCHRLAVTIDQFKSFV